jgi:hypothetical protein
MAAPPQAVRHLCSGPRAGGARPGGGPVAGVLAALFAGGPAGRPGGGVLGAGDPLVAGGPGGRAAGGALMGVEGLPLTIGITQWDIGHSPAGDNDAVVLRSSHTYKSNARLEIHFALPRAIGDPPDAARRHAMDHLSALQASDA